MNSGEVFGTTPLGADTKQDLLDLVQGSGSVIIDFSTPLCDWNLAAHRDIIWGLAGYIKDELLVYELQSSMEGFFGIVTCINQHKQVHRRVIPAASLFLPHPRSLRSQPTVMSQGQQGAFLGINRSQS